MANKRHSKYSHYRPMIIAGAISGVIVSATFGLIVWLVSTDTTKESSGPTEQSDITPIKIKQEQVSEPITLIFGGERVLPGYTYVALYGNPEYKTLGALGEQSLSETYVRVKNLANEYQKLTESKVIPTLEIIMTIASAGPTENNDYSQELAVDKVKSWVDSAVENEIYVVLDLQPGRNSFLDQAKAYEEVLKNPNVGLALDPEWRLNELHDKHLVKVGSVKAEEVNQTSEWLAELVKNNKLPQKLFIIHQFKDSMITNRETLKTDREELAYVLHMDGHGTLGQKLDTWNRLNTNLPANLHMAWKNFYDEDKPTPTPEQTMQQTPRPVFVSYQ